MKVQYLLAAASFVAAGLSYWLGYTPLLLVWAMTLMSLLTYGFYVRDKAAAVSGEWRVPEKTLHSLALFGGWPGALVAQARVRHKTRKLSFQLAFWLTVVLNGLALAWLHGPEGRPWLRNGVFELESLVMTEISSPQAASAVLRLIQYRHP